MRGTTRCSSMFPPAVKPAATPSADNDQRFDPNENVVLSLVFATGKTGDVAHRSPFGDPTATACVCVAYCSARSRAASAASAAEYAGNMMGTDQTKSIESVAAISGFTVASARYVSSPLAGLAGIAA